MEYVSGEVRWTTMAVREARRQIAETIKREGLTLDRASDRNRDNGWRIVIGNAVILEYRWGKGERAVISRMLEAERGY